MKAIKVQNNFEGFHAWPKAPKEVDFLRNKHRHIFYVTATIEVLHNDRELEFFIVQRFIKKIIETKILGKPELRRSCEDIAETILDYLEAKYRGRMISVEVSEDRENSSVVNNYESF